MNSKNKISALHEKAGISPPEIIIGKGVDKIQNSRKKQTISKEWIEGIL